MKQIKLSMLAGMMVFACGIMGVQAQYKAQERYDLHQQEGKPKRTSKGKYKKARGAPYRDSEGYRFVYAESWYGFQKVVAPVRRADLGDQVRLPGGTWVYCEASCEYTLRKQSLDFWESVGNSSFVSPGYFRKDIYIDDYGHRRY